MQMQGVGRYAAVAFDLMELFNPCGLLMKTPLVGGSGRRATHACIGAMSCTRSTDQQNICIALGSLALPWRGLALLSLT